MLFRAAVRAGNPVLNRLCQGLRRLSTVPTTTQTVTDVQTQESDMLETIDIEDLPRAQKRFAKQFEKVKLFNERLALI
ncbi:hypothetical protein KIN20_010538 [Parelaphostrongylus tenuis]|uniref:Uncharacterized protein n=1 Tax=Parelaphostrongylus tenuis TaxID=148309 RepID=A0AAD5MU64_PARTN|nr:hypothetical protein KIN20_010538 [Parelaphostrongylus tenuis]